MEDIRGLKHPLQTELIVEQIFLNIEELEDIKSCRLVCKAWNLASHDAIKEAAPLVTIDDRTAGKTISDFLKLVKVKGRRNIFKVPPFMTKFKIISLKGSNRKFWDVCGTSMEYLNLISAHFQPDEFRHAIFQSCPNLEDVRFDRLIVDEDVSVPYPSAYVPPQFPQNRNLKKIDVYYSDLDVLYWMELFSHFPSLEDLSHSSAEECAVDMIDALSLARNHNDQCWLLKRLNFDLHWFEEPDLLLPLLAEGNMALESLSISGIDADNLGNGILRRILYHHSSSLKSLYLKTEELQCELVIHDPESEVKFESLEKVHLQNAKLQSPLFLSSFDNLEELDLWDISLDPGFRGGPMDNWCVPSCTKLTVLLEHFDSLDLRVILGKLPNIEELTTLHCDDEKFRVICETLGNLEELDMMYNRVTDAGISGFDLEDVAKINEEVEENAGLSLRPITVERPNLSSLKNLKSFRGNDDISTRCDLGLCAALFGVQQLPKLQHLSLSGDKLEIWNRLCAQFPWDECED